MDHDAKAEDVLDMRGTGDIGPTGRKTSAWAGSKRPPGIDPEVWARLHRKKQKAQMSKQYEDWLEQRREALKAGSAAGSGSAAAGPGESPSPAAAAVCPAPVTQFFSDEHLQDIYKNTGGYGQNLWDTQCPPVGG